MTKSYKNNSNKKNKNFKKKKKIKQMTPKKLALKIQQMNI